MKAVIIRQSGRPIDLENEEAVREAINLAFDKAEAKWGMSQESAKKTQRYLRLLERDLKRRFPDHKSIKVPASAKGWADLSESYKATLMVGKSTNGSLLVIIQDAD